jgi:hypothetical protein
MSVTCRDVSLVSVVSVSCGAIYRQTEKRQVQLRYRQATIKNPNTRCEILYWHCHCNVLSKRGMHGRGHLRVLVDTLLMRKIPSLCIDGCWTCHIPKHCKHCKHCKGRDSTIIQQPTHQTCFLTSFTPAFGGGGDDAFCSSFDASDDTSRHGG